jgi:hypothetical protein
MNKHNANLFSKLKLDVLHKNIQFITNKVFTVYDHKSLKAKVYHPQIFLDHEEWFLCLTPIL